MGGINLFLINYLTARLHMALVATWDIHNFKNVRLANYCWQEKKNRQNENQAVRVLKMTYVGNSEKWS